PYFDEEDRRISGYGGYQQYREIGRHKAGVTQARTERVQADAHECVVAVRIRNGPAHEGERRQGELGDLIGPQKSRVAQAARNHIGEDGAKLADQRHGDHRIGEGVDDGGHKPSHGPHPEEPCPAWRLEGWPLARPRPRPSFETPTFGRLLRTRLMDDIDM